ncbi:MAG: 50S ribosomal protein L34e [Candidatus Hodarchaeales archaeon]
MRIVSRVKKQKKIKTPGGKNRTHYIKRVKSTVKCTSCGKKLNGAKNLRVSKLRKLGKTERLRNQEKFRDICPSCRGTRLQEKFLSSYSD